ncbi:GDSL-like lipase/acylhydrolase family protein [Nocardia tenerifensis]|uniref:GDSL-like lipase/acylhydrolase family protein n=1 Tax=Nocardia tenerifensis TaxID=228006 RepID=A0A318KAT4_9NOCA|nr:SGNH/GDSL hydrolase family protein [Nocardia tenerifensis]PXX70977.1 GDSL-like lipase/acylhydrolase family protein [Nocardia tenerifensis]
MRRTSRVVVAGAALGVVLSGAPAASADPGFGEYVALGDSWAADASLTQATDEFVPLGCAQSRGDYAKQVAAALAVPVFRDATCGGATTKNLTAPQSVPQGLNPPQFDRLTPTTDLVTLEIGGNDAALAATVQSCLTTDPAATPCLDALVVDGVDQMSLNILAAEPTVIAAVQGVRERSPRARILLIDYLQGVGIGPGCFPTVPISDPDADWLGRKLIELDTMLARVADATGAEFVDTYRTSAGHDGCQPPGTRWVEGLVPWSTTPPGPAVPFHPNQLGADHQARSVLAALGR